MSCYFHPIRAAVFIVFTTLCIPALAQDYQLGDLLIRAPWARPLPAVAANGAAYLEIVNRGGTDRLLRLSTPAANHPEIHTHIHENGMMKMRKLDALALPSGETITLKPGGLHLMLLGLNQPMKEGTEFPVTLHFERAGSLEIIVEVRKPATQ